MKIVKGTAITCEQLLAQVGESVLGLIVCGEIPTPSIVVQIIDEQLRLVLLDSDKPVATGHIDLPADSNLYVVANPMDAIKAFTPRYHLICKAYGLRH